MFDMFMAVLLAHAFMGLVALDLAIIGFGIHSIWEWVDKKKQQKKLKETKKVSKTT